MYGDHFCPNCNATLEDQSGFDSDLKTWICEECGTLLYGDDLEETMDLYGNVVWYCDSCGEILNVQSGFSDYYSTWECTECGYENRISDDDIYESEEDYQNSNKRSCPSCGSILEDQYSFNEYEDTHTCTDCGTELYNKDDEYQVLYRCPNCDEVLNEQYNFDANDEQYECDECGTVLYRDGDEYSIIYTCPECGEILNEQSGFYEDFEWECENCGSNLEKMDNTYVWLQDDEEEEDDIDEEVDDTTAHLTSSESEQLSEKKKKRKQTSNSGKPSKSSSYIPIPSHSYEPPIRLLDDFPTFEEYVARNRNNRQPVEKSGSILGRIAGALSSIKARKVGISSYELRGMHIDQVHNYLIGKGFCNFRLMPYKDICKGSYYSQGEVYYISIGNKTDFDRTDTFPFNAEIDIHYHEKETIAFPFSSKQVVGKEYREIANRLASLGFSDVNLCPMRDLILGLRKNAGRVERVVVNGRSKYKKDLVYDYDVNIEIYYHSFNKDKRK